MQTVCLVGQFSGAPVEQLLEPNDERKIQLQRTPLSLVCEGLLEYARVAQDLETAVVRARLLPSSSKVSDPLLTLGEVQSLLSVEPASEEAILGQLPLALRQSVRVLDSGDAGAPPAVARRIVCVLKQPSSSLPLVAVRKGASDSVDVHELLCRTVSEEVQSADRFPGLELVIVKVADANVSADYKDTSKEGNDGKDGKDGKESKAASAGGAGAETKAVPRRDSAALCTSTVALRSGRGSVRVTTQAFLVPVAMLPHAFIQLAHRHFDLVTFKVSGVPMLKTGVIGKPSHFDAEFAFQGGNHQTQFLLRIHVLCAALLQCCVALQAPKRTTSKCRRGWRTQRTGETSPRALDALC